MDQPRKRERARYKQMKDLITAGLDNKQIADKLGVSLDLVHRYRAILRKNGIAAPKPDYQGYDWLSEYNLTPKELRYAITILKVIDAGGTIVDAADALDTLESNVSTLASIIRSKGVPLPKFQARKRPNNLERIDALAKKKLTVSAISKITGLTPNLISQVLAKLRSQYPEDQVPEYLWPMDAGGTRRQDFIGRKLKPRRPIDTPSNQPVQSESRMVHPNKSIFEGLRQINEASKCADKTVAIDGSESMKKGRKGKPKAKPPETHSEAALANVKAIIAEGSVKSITEAHKAVALIESFAKVYEVSADSLMENFIRWGEKKGYANVPATRKLVKAWVTEVFGGASWDAYERKMKDKAEKDGDPEVAANAAKYRRDNEGSMKKSGIKFTRGKPEVTNLGGKNATFFNRKKKVK